MAVAVFNYGTWSALFPDLATKVSAQSAQAYFDMAAALYLDNTDCSPIPNVTARLAVLNLITAHLAQIGLPESEGGTGIVGRVSSATEGSVSVSSELNVPGSAAWWSQTPWGLSAWQALSALTTAHYVPGPGGRVASPAYGGPLGTLYFGGNWGAGPRWPY